MPCLLRVTTLWVRAVLLVRVLRLPRMRALSLRGVLQLRVLRVQLRRMRVQLRRVRMLM